MVEVSQSRSVPKGISGHGVAEGVARRKLISIPKKLALVFGEGAATAGGTMKYTAEAEELVDVPEMAIAVIFSLAFTVIEPV